MKSIILFITWGWLAVGFAAPIQNYHAALARAKADGGGGGGYSYLVQQDFESPYDWSENGPGGTADESYTGVVLEGSKSLLIATTAQYMRAYKGITASNNLTLCFMFRFVTAPGDYVPFVQIWDNATATVGAIDLESGKFFLEHGLSQGGGTMSYATGTNYYGWLEWEKSTSTNGKLNLFVSTTTTKPGSPDASRTAGTATAQAEYIALGPQGSATCDIIFDHVRVIAGAAGTVTTWPP